MGGLTSPFVPQIGSTPGQTLGPGIAQINLDPLSASVITGWNPVATATIANAAQWENGFVPALCGSVALNDHFTSQILSTYNTVAGTATDRVNCFSAYVMAPATGVQSPQCRLQFTLTAGPTFSIDVDPRTGVLIAQAGNPTNPQVQRIVLPLYGNTENVVLYRISFAFNSGGIATGQGWFWPRTDGVAAGTVIFGGTQLEGQVTSPSAFIPGGYSLAPGSRLIGQSPRQSITPEMRFVLNQSAIYTVNPLADQDTWLQCDTLAGNIIDLPLSTALMPDMPTGSRLLITQSPNAIGGITTVQGAANAIIAPGGITASYTSLTFPSTDFPNVTQMLLVKTNVQFQWQILETSAGGSGSGGLFIQSGAGAVPVTFQNKDRRIFDVLDFGADSTGATDVSAAFILALAALGADGDLRIPKGRYLFKSNVPVTNDNVRIYGGGTLLYSAAWTGTLWEFFSVSGANCRIEGLVFDGQNGAGPAAADFWPIRFGAAVGGGGAEGKVLNCAFQNFAHQTGGHAGAPIGFVGATGKNGLVTGCSFLNCHGGIFTQAAKTNVTGNIFDTISDVAVAFNGSSSIQSTATGNTVMNTGDFAAFAVEEGANQWSITGNTIRNCGIAFDQFTSAHTTAEIAGCFNSNTITVDAAFSGATQPSLIKLNQYYKNTVIDANKITLDTGALVLLSTPFLIYSTGLLDHQITNNMMDIRVAASVGAIVFAGTGNGVFAINTVKLNAVCPAAVEMGATQSGRIDLLGNLFDAPKNWAVIFDIGNAWSGLCSNRFISPGGNWYTYFQSHWGNLSIDGVSNPNEPWTGSDHILSNVAGYNSRAYTGATNAAPTGGTWQRGDVLTALNPAHLGSSGQVCTAAGAPGTWFSLAAIT